LESKDLRKAGLKVTLPRVKILEILEKQVDQRHLSAEKVYRILLSEDEEIGLATVAWCLDIILKVAILFLN